MKIEFSDEEVVGILSAMYHGIHDMHLCTHNEYEAYKKLFEALPNKSGLIESPERVKRFLIKR